MDAEFRYLSGAFAGQVRILRKEFATAGRHPSADLPFDLTRDLDVSGRHAAVFRQAGRWILRDLDSTNGTWVNGARLRGDHVLSAGDLIRFGDKGPELRFQPYHESVPGIPATAVSPTPDAITRPLPGPPAQRPRPGTTERIRAEVARQTAGWRRAAVAGLLGGGLVLAVLAGILIQKGGAAAAERERLLRRTDSLLTALAAGGGGAAALEAELARARREIEGLRARIADRSAGARALDTLGAALARAGSSGGPALEAARFDRAAVDSANADAVTVVVSELPAGRRISGSGFVASVRGDTGWVVTARHLVTDSAGRRAWRLGVIFHGSAQNFRAEPVAVDEEADLALLVVRVRGGVPAVRALGHDPHAGQPVAILGYPQGLDPGGEWRATGVRAVGFTGTIREVSPVRLAIDGYGVKGSSGSPAFGADGAVVGMVYAGDPGSAGRIVYAVPVGRIRRLLER